MMNRVIPLITLILTLLLLSACDDAPPSRDRAEAAPPRAESSVSATTIVALGDSLTAGLGVEFEQSYPALLEKKLQRQGYAVRVVNAGVSGETTSGTRSRLNWILKQNPAIVILVIGANDGLRGLDPELIEANIDALLTELEAHGVVTVLGGMKMVHNLGEEYTARFNAIYPRLAAEHDVVFMPFFLAGVAAVPELNRADGIHPNAAGYARIVDNLSPYLEQAIGRLEQAAGEGGEAAPQKR